jgi:thyroid receptor-interacting protein 11
VVLERQLEQCNNLNENLEEKYHQLQEQFSTIMSQQEVPSNEEAAPKMDWDAAVQQLKLQIEHLEVDKGNLLFEINELKADRSVLETEMLDYKSRAESTEEQHAVVTEDLAHVVAKLHALEKQQSEANRRYEETIDAQAKVIADKEKELKTVQTEVKKLQRDTNQNESLTEGLQSAEQRCTGLAEEVRMLEAKIVERQTQHDQACQALQTEKNDLIALITTKHNENVQYHNEIQRLGQLLMAEIEKNKTLSSAAPEACQTCRQLQEELAQAKEAASSQISGGEAEKMTDQIQFLKEKSDILTKNIMMEQSNQKLLNQELVEMKEQKQALVKETDRLRQHLLEIEESHTMETVELQKTIDDLRQKLSHIEMDAKQSSTAYTSASIRANQQAETLQAQCHLLQQQRDEIANRLSAYEDHEFKNQAALTNLQCALEQFQKGIRSEMAISSMAGLIYGLTFLSRQRPRHRGGHISNTERDGV